MAGLLSGFSIDSGLAATLSGRVVDPMGVPITNLPVQVLRISASSGNLVVWTTVGTTTSNNGMFVTGDLPDNDYWLRINDTYKDTNGMVHPTGYEAMYWSPGNAMSPSRPVDDPIVIVNPQPDLTGLDFILRPAAGLRGTVTAPGITNYNVMDFDVWDAVTDTLLPLISARANPDGTFVIHGFPAGGRYHVLCDAPDASGLISVYQGDIFLREDALPLRVPGIRILGSQTELTRSVAIGDLDGDGLLDAVTGSVDGGPRAYLNHGNVMFDEGTPVGSGLEPTWAAALGDLDGD
ncbi:MAG: FG-GAP-like repeat-containing protein, partial [Verrucomicrobiota bacterium]